MSDPHEKMTDDELYDLVRHSLERENPEVDGEVVHTERKGLWKGFVMIVRRVTITAKREKQETVIAARILKRYLVEGDLTKEEKKFLKAQSTDLARILPIVAVQAVPAPIPITPVLIALGGKIGIDLVPKAQDIPEEYRKEKDEED